MRDQKIGNLCITLKRVSVIATANGLTTTKAKINAGLVEARLMSGDMFNNPDVLALPDTHDSQNSENKIPDSTDDERAVSYTHLTLPTILLV